MNRKIGIYILFLFCVIRSISFAQSTFRNHPDIKKDGAIIFYLKTDSMRGAILRKYGDTVNAERFERNARELNQRLINSFRKDFTFCPVYFISATQVDKFIKNKNYRAFYNDSMVVDTSIYVKEKNLIYASLDYEYIIGKNGGYRSITPIDMISLKDSTLTPLPYPFPYYTQVSTEIFLIPRKAEVYPKLLQNTLEIWYYYPSKRTVRILTKMGLWEGYTNP
ncbi:MAG TPA: hypothetical protein VIL57_07205 [Bacteroidia bacterium]